MISFIIKFISGDDASSTKPILKCYVYKNKRISRMNPCYTVKKVRMFLKTYL